VRPCSIRGSGAAHTPFAHRQRETSNAMEPGMSDGHSDYSRLDALEMLAAHQEQTIAELNDAITAQWRKIDALERQVASLHAEMQNVGVQRDAPEPPPPHY
jgi:SlyX protein